MVIRETRIKRKKLPEDVAQGTREQTDLEKFEAENAPVEPKVQPKKQKDILRQISEFGLLPASFAARQINRLTGNQLSGGRDLSTAEIQSLTADSPVGYGLGLTTVALEAYLGARIAGRFLGKAAPKLPKISGRAARRVIPRISEGAIKREGIRAGLTRSGIAQVKRELGKMRVSQVARSLANNQGSMVSRYLKGSVSGKRVGGSILLGWLGADTISQSTSFQASKTEGNVIFGQVSKSEGLSELDTLKSYNNMGKAAVLAAAAISPAAIPFLIFGWQSSSLADNQIERSKRVIEGL